MNTPKLLGVALAASLAAGTASADTLVLRDGRSVTGQFVGATGSTVQLRTDRGIERHDLATVATIRLDPRQHVGRSRAEPAAADSRVIILGSGPDQSIERVSRAP